MSDGSQSIPDDIEIGSKKNVEWLKKKLTEADNLFEKGEALLEKIYGDASNGHTIFKCERKADGREPPEPTVVAIGPYHRNCKNRLKFDDDYKLEITRFMFKHCKLDAEKYLEEMEKNEEDVRSCYDKDLPEWKSEEFRTMLLLDSSFILFVMDALYMRELEPVGFYAEYMALHLDVREHSEQIKLDLLTVDNQIPFFTIEILLGCFPQDSTICEESIEELALWCFDDIWPMKNEEQVTSVRVPDHFHHLLHLFHWSRMPKKGYEMDCEERGSWNALVQRIPSATELQKYATKFKKKLSGSYLDITFNHGLTLIFGVINIPTLRLTEDSKPIFRNLIKFEATPTSSVLCFTAYTAFMSCILQGEDDVKLLSESGIVASTNYKDAEVVKFFEELNEEIESSEMPMTLLELYDSVTNHHNSRISQWYANFRWIKVALAGSYLLFLLTLLQAIYSVLSYHDPKNK